MVIFRMEEQEQNLIEDGEYVGELADIVEVNGAHGPCVRFVFKLVGDQYEGLQTSMLVGQKLTPGSKLDSLLRALGVDPLEVGENTDSDVLVGRKAKIYVEQSVNKRDGKVYSNVTKVKSFKAVPKPVAAPVSQPKPAPVPVPAPVQPQPVQPAPAPVAAPKPTEEIVF